jgi:hypothetical protein
MFEDPAIFVELLVTDTDTAIAANFILFSKCPSVFAEIASNADMVCSL